MTSVNDIRSELSFFSGATATRSLRRVARSAQRSDADVHNAGMVQFKNVFTGVENGRIRRRRRVAEVVRAGASTTTSTMSVSRRGTSPFRDARQLFLRRLFQGACDRTGLDGSDKGLCDPARKLSVTIYEDDDEAHSLWKKVAGLSDDKIVRLGAKSTSGRWVIPGPAVRARGSSTTTARSSGAVRRVPGGGWRPLYRGLEPRLHAVRQHPDGSRTNLPRPSVDTSMGLERFASVLQGTITSSRPIFRTLVDAAAQARVPGRRH